MSAGVAYSCPHDGRVAFRAAGLVSVAIEWKCTKCRKLVQPVSEAGVVIRTYRCSGCGREQSCTDPVNDRVVCMPCGTPTLTIVAELNSQSPTRAERRGRKCLSH